ncbi:MAG: NAD(P)/FAD-dependent oxidoreductase, partial [Lachnospiraceae bacterium]|nr:NAD(P)/FAD-dependent oxidoreductase [Lachnospiraceae bacterium]
MRYDIAIIGTGPGGLEAAVTAKIRNKNIILFGSRDLSVKLRKAAKIENYLGYPDVTGRRLANAYKRHLDAMGIEITEDRIQMAYNMGDYYMLQGANNDMYEADAVIIASGVVSARPLKGEEENLGRGVSYCATCDASIVRGRDVAVIGYDKEQEEEARFLSEVASGVTYFPMYKGDPKLPKSVRVINEHPVELRREGDSTWVKTREGAEEYPFFSVFVMREAIAPGRLVPGLETEGPHIKTDRSMA